MPAVRQHANPFYVDGLIPVGPMAERPITDLYHRIIALLESSGVAFEHYDHEHIHTSADAARVRGTNLEEAAKALILAPRSGDLIQCVVNGHRRLDLRAIKQLLGEKDLALAAPDAVLARTTCTVGSVPPLGNLFEPPMRIIVDKDVFAREFLVFSAATHHHSIRMKSADWLRLTGAEVREIGKEK